MSKNLESSPTPVTVALVDESDLATAGLHALLAPFGERVRLLDDRAAVAHPETVDVVLFEPRATSETAASLLTSLLDGGAATSVAFSWAPPQPGGSPDLVHLPKTLAASQLVVALEDVVAGRRPSHAAVVETVDEPVAVDTGDPEVGRLTSREHDVLSLIAGGLSNRDIAAHLGLSLNSVKTYIRTAYGKIGADRRTQAVLWGLEHGLTPAQRAVSG